MCTTWSVARWSTQVVFNGESKRGYVTVGQRSLWKGPSQALLNCLCLVHHSWHDVDYDGNCFYSCVVRCISGREDLQEAFSIGEVKEFQVSQLRTVQILTSSKAKTVLSNLVDLLKLCPSILAEYPFLLKALSAHEHERKEEEECGFGGGADDGTALDVPVRAVTEEVDHRISTPTVHHHERKRKLFAEFAISEEAFAEMEKDCRVNLFDNLCWLCASAVAANGVWASQLECTIVRWGLQDHGVDLLVLDQPDMQTLMYASDTCDFYLQMVKAV